MSCLTGAVFVQFQTGTLAYTFREWCKDKNIISKKSEVLNLGRQLDFFENMERGI